jgi:hypothetical protein
MTAIVDTMHVTCNDCGYPGTLAALALHSCDIQTQGGRCEDYPCCGHTDGDGCQTLPSHTSDFYYRNPHLLHEPGSPEWADALADMAGDPPEWACGGCDNDYENRTEVFENGDKIDDDCVSCRVRWFILHEQPRAVRHRRYRTS